MLTPEQEIILSEILGKPKEFIIAHPEIKLSKAQQERFGKMSRALKSGMPLAYVLGHKWFYGNKFTVNKNTLIPRPETEQLVGMALEVIKKHQIKTVADIGTGSGAIIVSIARDSRFKTLDYKLETLGFFGTDISAKALAVARKNSKAIAGNKIVFLKGSLLSPLSKKLSGQKNVLIVANLPYISKKELQETSIKREPRLALYGGKNSYDKIERLLRQAAKLDLKNSRILLETNWDHKKPLSKIIKKHLPDADVKFHKDIWKRDRFVEIYLT